MKIRFLKLKNWFYLSLLGALGLNGCSSTKAIEQNKDVETQPVPRNEMRALYGVPTRDFQERVPQTEADDTIATSPKSKPQLRSEQRLLYGVPTIDFRVSGRVVDENGKPVRGVQVFPVTNATMPDNYLTPEGDEEQYYIHKFADTTDAQGNFHVQAVAPVKGVPYLIVRDIDGKANGSYEHHVENMTEIDEEKNPKTLTQEGMRTTWEQQVTVTLKKKK